MQNNDSPNSPHDFAHHVLTWFDKHGRKHLPWQQNRTAYRVWVSEIMLQQTQVATVIPYYERFMASFPTVETLAQATQEDVLQHWAGLGYYARGRNLHKCAQTVVENYSGVFPNTVDELTELSGIGRSTAGAIISLSSGERAVILDGNVKRVLSRYHGMEGWPGKTSVANALWTHAEEHTPERRCDDYNQAMMDLGATLCTRSRPNCDACPLKENCYAYDTGKQAEFPHKKPKKTLPVKQTQWLVIVDTQQRLLLQQRPQQGIWGGLWSFPELDLDDDHQGHCEAHYGAVAAVCEQPAFRHTFSHYHLDIQPSIFSLSKPHQSINDGDAHEWFTMDDLLTIGVPAPVKKLIAQLDQSKTLKVDLPHS